MGLTDEAGSPRVPRRRRWALPGGAAALVFVAVVSGLLGGLLPAGAPWGLGGSPDVTELYDRKFTATAASDNGKPRKLNSGQVMSIVFRHDGRVLADAGCNGTGGPWRLDEGRLDWGRGMGWTMAVCGDREQEQWFVDLLLSKPLWRLDANTLVVSDDDQELTLVDTYEYRRPGELVGQSWVATSTERGKSDRELRADTWMEFRVRADGRVRVGIGCESAVGRAEIGHGTFAFIDELTPRTAESCSPSKARQDTTWFWEFLDQPLRWWNEETNLQLRSTSESIGFSVRRFGSDPKALAGRTFLSHHVTGVAYEEVETPKGLDYFGGVTIRFGDDGTGVVRTACEGLRTVVAVEEGWLRWRGELGGSADDCDAPQAERWLRDFIAEQPSWYLDDDDWLILMTGDRTMGTLEERDFRAAYPDGRP